jgi:hypothetical protein
MIGRTPISTRPPASWLTAALGLSCSFIFLIIILAETMMPALRKPVEPLLCDRGVVFMDWGRSVRSHSERVVCPGEGSGMVYGHLRGERRNVTLPYYALMALLYGATSFAVFAVLLYRSSKRRGGAGY